MDIKNIYRRMYYSVYHIHGSYQSQWIIILQYHEKHRKMSQRILFVHQSAELYGSDRTFEQSIRAYKTTYPNSCINVILPYEGPLIDKIKPYVNKVYIEPLAVLRKANLKSFRLLNVPAFIRSVRKAKKMINAHDLTYINTVVIIDYLIASRLAKRSCLVHVHELPVGIEKIILSCLLNLSSGLVVFNSQPTKHAFILPEKRKTYVILNGSNIKNDTPIDDASHLKILLIGRFSTKKGQMLFLQSLALLPGSIKHNIEVRLVGDVYQNQMHFKQEIIENINKLALGYNVQLCKFTDDPTQHYLWSNLVVVPSLKPEPFGLVAIEAMGYGRPVIAAQHGGLRDIIVNKVTGLFFQPGNRNDLAEKIIYYANNTQYLKTHGEAGRTVFIENYDESHYLKNMTKAIDSQLEAVATR